MDKEELEEEELESMFNRLDHEVDLLFQAIDGKGENLEPDYANKVARAQLESVGEVVESMSEHMGEGDMISVTTPSQLKKDED